MNLAQVTRASRLTDRRRIERIWIFEHKLDGFRALAWTGRAPALVSRNNLSHAAAFPEIIAALVSFSQGASFTVA